MRGLYEQLVLPEPFTILNRRLKPFSFGHFIILKRFNVGSVSDNLEKPTREDLIFSIFICSHTFEENEQLLYSGKCFAEVIEWGKSFVDKEIDWPAKAQLFDEYQDYHTQLPKFRVNKRDTESVTESNSEWYEHVLKYLLQHYTESEVMNMCFGLGYYKYLAYLESKGIVTFRSDRMDALIQDIKKRKQEKEQANGR